MKSKKRKVRKRAIKFLLKFLLFFIVIVCYIVIFSEKVSDNGQDNNGSNNATDNGESMIIPKTYLNKITYTVNINKEIEEAIITYMDLYYKSMQELKAHDMTNLFINSEQAYINQTALSLLIESRLLQPNDLRLHKASYDLDIRQVTKNGNDIRVVVRENSYLNFNFMRNIDSKLFNIENEFVFRKVNDEYKIVSYSKVQDFFVMITNNLTMGGDYKTRLDNIKNNHLANMRRRINTTAEQRQAYLNDTGITRRNCDNPYNRERALEYAKRWITDRNPEWPRYDANCQNYASQMIHVGGVPMDNIGNRDAHLQWSSPRNGSGTLVYTWTFVPFFFTYVRDNTGFGLCGSVDVNLFYAEPGDIIHMGVTGPTRHVSVVSGTVIRDGRVIDVLVHSNTVDKENWPMSAYTYPFISLIKIYGWNN